MMLEIRLWGFASILCRACALFTAVLCAQTIMQEHFGEAVLRALVFGSAWHASEVAKRQSFDLLAKAMSKQPSGELTI